MRSIIVAVTGAALLMGAAANAAPACREKGKFVRCPPVAVAKPARCKDGRGKFIKCGMPGAKHI